MSLLILLQNQNPLGSLIMLVVLVSITVLIVKTTSAKRKERERLLIERLRMEMSNSMNADGEKKPKMDSNNIDIFIASMRDKFPSENLMIIRNRLENIDANRYIVIQSLEYKDPTTIFLFSLFLGGLGIDRFVLGDIGLGFLKLITFGGFFIWTVIDWFTAYSRAKEYNYNKFIQVAV